MRDVDEGDADLVVDRVELDEHALAELGVEGRERLVEEEDRGLVDEGPRDGHPLLLAAREHRGLLVGVGLELDEGEVPHHELVERGGSGTCLMRRGKATFSKTVRWGKRA